MRDRIDLDDRARNMVGEAAWDMKTYDADTLREEVNARAGQEAENACTYTADCRQIVDDYEREYGDEAADICSGKTYAAPDFRDAMVAYANDIAYCALRAKAAEMLDGVEEKAGQLVDLLAARGLDVSAEDLAISQECPHGWAAHDSEDDGACLWISRQLDGCNAIALDAGPFWLSYTWTPESAE